ncbi:fumarylacetoacetate hydrolase family protein [Wenxinia marina]|uniref:2-keto-4-pentenoate hydratase/2-oxohepta-3-ene-1,7-dioic acid hydratase (Catechol pathway) n=1 Tax=Wenxinia marina DSM 24838 TaxID=1123501 RepID=A0A0D0Q174_9RHOB|nr:fumarylacetoacetate hydrolase family protein [Wenxinia marina]KIQ68319.1 2-keto-4-pentenoate hydratase/2-oxohepta-3-ene-1,7-dioic acid hydratase (catechol pathway) [Wenxinia marina DSM 24838]GGL79695.1 gentisate 1,2-dioxygenase [Wenxinia marina]
MRLCRYDGGRLGVVRGDMVHDVTDVLEHLPPLSWPCPPGDHLMNHWDEMRPRIEAAAERAEGRPVADVSLLSPVANPGKIVAAPVNYQLHLDESRADTGINFGTEIKTIHDYGVFLKATSSLIGAGDKVVVDWDDRRTDHEIELALVIGKRGFRIAEEDALSHVAGYMIGLDMTIRGTEDRSFRKSLDTFTVLGPHMVTADEIGDPAGLGFALTVNGEPRQASNTSLLILNVPQLIAYASKAYTLHPGDVIMTGTPEGVAPVKPGDTIHARIDKVGEMSVAVG